MCCCYYCTSLKSRLMDTHFLSSEHFFVVENKNNDYCYGRNATVNLWLDFIMV